MYNVVNKMRLISRIYILLKYKIRGNNHIRVIGSGNIKVSRSVKLKNVKIYVQSDAELEIGDNCKISNSVISVSEGKCRFGAYDILQDTCLTVDKGEVYVGHHTKLAMRRAWVRFGGVLSIGDYTNINSGSEIRCDEKVSIGSYNQISYNVNIWDTNTHNILSREERRELTREKYPYYGFEQSRPSTKPLVIGDDCWVGENCAILKGSNIGDTCILGYGTIIAGGIIEKGKTIVNKRDLTIISR